MPISPEHAEKVKEHINKKWLRKECALCGKNDWAVDGYAHIGISENPTVMALGGTMLMLCTVTCKNCGNTILVNLIAAGIVKPVVVPTGVATGVPSV